MRILILFIISLLFIGCSKPDPNPELKDEIYADLNARLAESSHALEAEEKQLEGFKKALNEVTPQTGQIKYAQKRVYDSEDKIEHLKQEKQWLTVKVEARLKEDKRNYAHAFAKGEKWPNPQEAEDYRTDIRLHKAKKEWDVKQRMKDAGVFSDPSKKAGGEKKEGGEKKKE